MLDLSNNLIRTLPESLGYMFNLERLFLRNNMIGDYDFPKSLATLTKLKDLNLSGNRLQAIPPQVILKFSVRSFNNWQWHINEIAIGTMV